MKLSKWKFLPALLLVWSVVAGELRAQHIHLNAGALATTNGAPLYFINADSFIASSGYVFNSVLRTNGLLNGYYDSGVTFTAVGSDGFDGPPAAPGAQLALVVKSVTGPTGSSWAFWESLQCDDFGDSITFSLPVGTTNGMNQFLLSQNTGLPGEDPYGHCHGRRFTMTKPGLHKVAVQIVDVSHNGSGSGPIHAPSLLYEFNFQAGLTILKLEKTNDQFAATFPSRLGSRFYLETNSVLDGSLPWGTAAGPLSGDNRIKAFIDPGAPGDGQRFFRLHQTTP
jgi:hypothetical protein